VKSCCWFVRVSAIPRTDLPLGQGPFRHSSLLGPQISEAGTWRSADCELKARPHKKRCSHSCPTWFLGSVGRSKSIFRSRSISTNTVDVLVLKHRFRRAPLGHVQHRTAYAFRGCHVLREKLLSQRIEGAHHRIDCAVPLCLCPNSVEWLDVARTEHVCSLEWHLQQRVFCFAF
jgi:hypothetical protein